MGVARSFWSAAEPGGGHSLQPAAAPRASARAARSGARRLAAHGLQPCRRTRPAVAAEEDEMAREPGAPRDPEPWSSRRPPRERPRHERAQPEEDADPAETSDAIAAESWG